MSKALREALIAKYKTPEAAVKALGLDAALLAADKGGKDEEKDDDKKGAKDSESAREFLKGKLSEDDMEAYDALCSKGMDDKDDDKDEKKAEDDEDDDEDEKKKTAKDDKDEDKVSKGAMDAALVLAKRETAEMIRTEQRAIRDAENAVRPYIGSLAIACDSAADVYKTAFKALGVDVKGVDPSAFPAMLKLVPVPGAKRTETTKVAMDSAGASSFKELFPNAQIARAV